MAKYNNVTYHKGYFSGVSNDDLRLIICKDKCFNPQKLQSYVLHRHHTYLIHSGMDITEEMILQHL